MNQGHDDSLSASERLDIERKTQQELSELWQEERKQWRRSLKAMEASGPQRGLFVTHRRNWHMVPPENNYGLQKLLREGKPIPAELLDVFPHLMLKEGVSMGEYQAINNRP